MRGERLGDRARARRGGAIDGDNHCCKPASSTSKLGKLVATGAMSSIVTGALLTRPATAKLMQMRWSRWPAIVAPPGSRSPPVRSEEHTSELQSLMRISYAVFCLKKKKHPLRLNNHLISSRRY